MVEERVERIDHQVCFVLLKKSDERALQSLSEIHLFREAVCLEFESPRQNDHHQFKEEVNWLINFQKNKETDKDVARFCGPFEAKTFTNHWISYRKAEDEKLEDQI